jgi:Asp-tRNA(Asn)/Glu-tRNA(Gln) amidotransferase A subunit family amidase
MQNDLCYLSAVEALAAFKARKLSPVELMRAVIDRAEAVEPKINAFPITRYEQALAEAKTAEAKYMKTDGRIRALEGVPTVIKDETTIKGWRTTFGSLVFKDNIDSYTAPSAERIIKAGALIHARSAAPEFSCAPYTHSRLWGVTRTPWNLDYSCGGSSGGAGASLAAGSTTLANGSDIGGSIRIPASMSGVVGYKPPYGRNPDSSPFNLDHYNHAGPMARTVADSALLQNVMSGPHPQDIVSLRPKLRIPSEFLATSRAGESPSRRPSTVSMSTPMWQKIPAPPSRRSAIWAPQLTKWRSAGTRTRSCAPPGPISAPSSGPGSAR